MGSSPPGESESCVVVIDVADLEVAAAFYSELTGYPGSAPRQPRARSAATGPTASPTSVGPTPGSTNRSQVDIHVADLDEAIARIEGLGG